MRDGTLIQGVDIAEVRCRGLEDERIRRGGEGERRRRGEWRSVRENRGRKIYICPSANLIGESPMSFVAGTSTFASKQLGRDIKK